MHLVSALDKLSHNSSPMTTMAQENETVTKTHPSSIDQEIEKESKEGEYLDKTGGCLVGSQDAHKEDESPGRVLSLKCLCVFCMVFCMLLVISSYCYW